MVYEVFLQTVKEALTERLGPPCTVTLCSVPQNNGDFKDAWCIGKPSDLVMPTIYPGGYYEQFCAGASIERIADEIAALCASPDLVSDIQTGGLADFDQVKGHIIYRLIHTDSNQSLLKGIPHIPWLDLSIVFYLLFNEEESGQAAALIHDIHCTMWGTDTGELYRLAASNTPRLLPARLKTMKEVIREIAMRHIGSCFDEELIDGLLDIDEKPQRLYVLSNHCGLHGACCILYDHVLKDFADSCEGDFIVLPSSIHEVLLVPDDGCLSYENLNSMVVEINRSEVPPEDRLSDHIYHYSRAEENLKVLPVSDSTEN